MPAKLPQVLDKAVAGLASTPSYERGLAYLEAGRVGSLRASAGRVGATVQGSEEYLVELRAKGGKVRFSCSCPIGREGAFCKHCVAVALAWLREQDDPAPTLDDARAHLETLPQNELIELLIDHAHDDEALARKLLLRAATPTSAKADVASLRALLEQAFVHRPVAEAGRPEARRAPRGRDRRLPPPRRGRDRGQGQARLRRGGAADRRDDASALRRERPLGGLDAYVEEVRTTHKPKRNLMKLMAGLDPVKSTS